MVAIPLVGGSTPSRSVALNQERTVNMYAEISEGTATRSNAALYNAAGLKLRWTLATLGGRGVRGLHTDTRTRRVFAVHGNTFYELNSDNTSTSHGTLVTDAGVVSMASNNTQVCIVDGPAGYIFTLATNTLTQIGDADFYGADTVAFLGSYFIFNRPNTDQFYQSAVNDGLTYNALDFSSADAEPDFLRAVVSAGRLLWLLGDTSVEAWYNSGNPSGVSFDRVDQSIIPIGIVGAHAWATLGGILCWLGSNTEGNATFYRGDNFTPVRISTHGVEAEWGKLSSLEKTRGYAYQQDGHQFFVWTHPDATWVYDLSTSLWHERQSFSQNVLGRHRVDCHTFGHGVHLGGDYADGRVYEMDLETFTDDDEVLPYIRRFPTISNGGEYIAHRTLEIDLERGVGLDGSPTVGADPQVLLRWSDDQGKTWSTFRAAAMGKIGETTARARWRRLGRSRYRTYELRINDPVKIAILGAELNR